MICQTDQEPSFECIAAHIKLCSDVNILQSEGCFWQMGGYCLGLMICVLTEYEDI